MVLAIQTRTRPGNTEWVQQARLYYANAWLSYLYWRTCCSWRIELTVLHLSQLALAVSPAHSNLSRVTCHSEGLHADKIAMARRTFRNTALERIPPLTSTAAQEAGAKDHIM
jgi:hypothetical protein